MHLPQRVLCSHGCKTCLSRFVFSYCKYISVVIVWKTFLVLVFALTLPFSDIDECMNSTVCGPESKCTNTQGFFRCACNGGWAPTDREKEPRQESNICIGKQGRKNPPKENCSKT